MSGGGGSEASRQKVRLAAAPLQRIRPKGTPSLGRQEALNCEHRRSHLIIIEECIS